jgi:hypothetical protein
VMAAVPANVPVNPVQLMDLAPVFPLEMVQVPEEVASKKTSSALVGTAAPPAPPTVSAHFVPAVPSHAAVPPRQKRSAILALLKSQCLVSMRIQLYMARPTNSSSVTHVIPKIWKGTPRFNVICL